MRGDGHLPSGVSLAGIGCGVAVLALTGVLLGGAFSQKKLLGMGFATMERRMTTALTAGCPPQLKRRLQDAYACVAHATLDGRLSESQAGTLGKATNAALGDRMVTPAEARRLLEIAEALCIAGQEGGR